VTFLPVVQAYNEVVPTSTKISLVSCKSTAFWKMSITLTEGFLNRRLNFAFVTAHRFDFVYVRQVT